MLVIPNDKIIDNSNSLRHPWKRSIDSPPCRPYDTRYIYNSQRHSYCLTIYLLFKISHQAFTTFGSSPKPQASFARSTPSDFQSSIMISLETASSSVDIFA